MKRWALIPGLVVVAAIGGLAIWRQTNRVQFIETLCKAGLPNLSRPKSVDPDDLDCVVLGPRRRVSGFLASQYHGSFLIVGDAIRFDDQGAYANETLDFAGSDGSSGPMWTELRRMREEAPETCFQTIWQVTLDGWSTETEETFGEMGLRSRGFFIHDLVSIEPVSPAQVAEVDGTMREYACVWTGDGGWRHLGTDRPAQRVSP